MFVRKKKNKSGSTSIQIIDKSDRTYRVIKTLGSSNDIDEIERLVQLGTSIINKKDDNQPRLFTVKTEVERAVENFCQSLSNDNIRTIGPELIFGTLFDRIGFNAIDAELFRHIVIARLVYPTSKLKTVDYLKRYQGKTIEVDAIYRFLDKLTNTHKETVQKIAFDYTRGRLKNISVVFYDMTTLYFEAEDEAFDGLKGYITNTRQKTG